jgi:hypothetical protein
MPSSALCGGQLLSLLGMDPGQKEAAPASEADVDCVIASTHHVCNPLDAAERTRKAGMTANEMLHRKRSTLPH